MSVNINTATSRNGRRATVPRGLFLLVLVLVMAASAGCGGDAGSDSGQAQDEYTLRVTNEVAVGAPLNETLNAWKDMVETKTEGRVTIELFPAGQLMTDKAAVGALSQGSIDMNISTTGWMAELVPAMQVFDLPYLFANDRQLEVLWEQDLGKVLNERLSEHNVRGIAILPLTGEIILASDRKVTQLSDLRGLKLRTFGGEAQQATLDALGATGVTVPASEIAPAIQTGVVDGIATGMTYWWENFREPLKYAVAPDMWQSPYAVWVNDASWDRLPSDLQSIILDAFTESQKVGLRQVEKSEQAALDSGRVTVLTPSEQQRWKEATRNVPSQFEEEFGADVIAAVEELRETEAPDKVE